MLVSPFMRDEERLLAQPEQMDVGSPAKGQGQREMPDGRQPRGRPERHETPPEHGDSNPCEDQGGDETRERAERGRR